MSLIGEVGNAVHYLVALAIVGVVGVFLFFLALWLLAVAGQNQNTIVAAFSAIIGLGILIGLYLFFGKR